MVFKDMFRLEMIPSVKPYWVLTSEVNGLWLSHESIDGLDFSFSYIACISFEKVKIQ